MRYWIVKGRRNHQDRDGDIESMLNSKEREGDWATRKPPKLWAEGDRVFFWSSSPDMYLIGLGEIRDIYPTEEDGDTVFLLGYLTKPFAVRPGIDFLRKDPVLKDASFLKASVAGTLFPLTDDQALRLSEIIQKANPRDSQIQSTFASWFSSSGPAVSPDIEGDDPDISGFEGEARRTFTLHRSREAKLRTAKVKEAKAKGELKCQVPRCGFDFAVMYGKLGEDYIQVHHLQHSPVEMALEGEAQA